MIAGTGNIQKESDNIVLEMAKVGKDVNKSEYDYVKEIMKFMSPTEFQNFKNSISGMANQFNVQINSLNEGGIGQTWKALFNELHRVSIFKYL